MENYYTNVRYVKIGDIIDLCFDEPNGTTWHVPESVGNRHYDSIMKLVEEGKLTITPAEEQQ